MKDDEFKKIIKSKQARYGISDFELSQALGISERQTKRYISSISNVKLKDFLIITKKLHIDNEEIIGFMKRGK